MNEDNSEKNTIETNESQSNTQVPPETPDYKEQFLRVSADLQNFSRRVEKERSEWMLTAQSALILSFIPFFEDFDRALEALEKTPEYQLHGEGLSLIQKNLKKTLLDAGIEEIQTTGSFNPVYHEALAHIESQDHASGDIVQIFSKGYTFKGKVIKPARVGVAK